MSDPPKSAAFSFSPATTSSGGLFGSNNSTANTLAKSGTPLFGQTTSTGQTTSLFSGGSAFGGNASAGGFNFGTSSGSFGTAPSTSQQPTNSSSSFSGFSTANKPSENPAAMQGHKTELFGALNSAGITGSIGPPSSSTFSPTPGEASTPNSKPSTGLSFPSTTPIGPPPSDPGMGASSASNLFSLKNTAPTTTQDSNTFTQGLGGFRPPLQVPQAVGDLSSTPFGSSGASLLSRPAKSEAGVFSNLNSSKDNQTQAPAVTSSSMFSGMSGHSSGAISSPQTSSSSLFSAPLPNTTKPNTLAPNGLGGALKASGPPSFFSKPAPSPTSTASSTAPGLSGALGGQGKSLRLSAPLSNEPSLGMLKNSTTASTEEIKNVGATSAQQAPPTSAAQPSLFSGVAQAAIPVISNNASNSNPNLGASTTGPTPPAQSRLKNKSMDEIITRWASDLSKYQKEFQKQAEQVSVWDRMLVENSEKIQKLYGSTLEAERATTEVERQLTAVENDQEELATWLDHYEKEVNQMMSTQVTQGESLQGPDQEREKTYKLAEKLSTRLEEMGKDLGEMIGEINDASSTLSKHKKADDPLSQVVKVLNSHLSQLQLIDQGAAALHAKVAAAKKSSQGMGASNGINGPSSDAAAGFYRSYMGRR